LQRATKSIIRQEDNNLGQLRVPVKSTPNISRLSSSNHHVTIHQTQSHLLHFFGGSSPEVYPSVVVSALGMLSPESSTLVLPLEAAEAFLDMFHHLLLHCISLRPGIFTAILDQLLTVPEVSTAETSFFSSSTVHAPIVVAEAFFDMFHHFCRHCFSFRPGTFAAVVAQLVVPNVSTAEVSLFSTSTTVHVPIEVAAAFLDMFRHFCRHCFSSRPGMFAAMLAQLVVPRVSTIADTSFFSSSSVHPFFNLDLPHISRIG
jgi:hypothetical protein